MKEFTTFLVENWRFLVESLLTVVSIFLVIFLRKKIKVSTTGTLYDEILVLIKEAESKYGAGHGEEKLSYVLTSLAYRLVDLGFSKDLIGDLLPRYALVVEDILSTPQKKGVPHESR